MTEYALDYEYWIHVEHFPFHQLIPENVIHDLLGSVIHQTVGRFGQHIVLR